MAMAVSATAMARGLLMLRLTMVPTVLATEAMAMAVLATAMARGLLMLRLTMVPTVLATEAMAMAVSDTAMASNLTSKDNVHKLFVKKTVFQISVLHLNLLLGKSNCNYELTKLKYPQLDFEKKK